MNGKAKIFHFPFNMIIAQILIHYLYAIKILGEL